MCFVIFDNGCNAGFLWNLVKNYWNFLRGTGFPWWLNGLKKKKKKDRNPPAMQQTREMQVQSLGWEDLLEERMTTHSSSLTRKSP